MFIEKNNKIEFDRFNWYEKNGAVIDITSISSSVSLNQYIVEINDSGDIPTFFQWLLSNQFRIYCLDDCRLNTVNMNKVQKKFLEIEKHKNNWSLLGGRDSIYYREYKGIENLDFRSGSYWFFSLERLNEKEIDSYFQNLNLEKSSFPNLSFIDVLQKNKELIAGYISWGESYFKPGTNEEPKVLVCYTGLDIDFL